MDKWKELELEKMRVGGNRKAKEFFESQPDFNSSWTLQEKYNSKAAALLRDKVATEASGKSWSEETSSARDYRPMLPHVHTANELYSRSQQSGYSSSSDRRDYSTSQQSTQSVHHPGALHSTYSDLEVWLRDNDQPATDRRYSSYQTTSSGMTSSYGRTADFSSYQGNASGSSWQSGWGLVGQLASAAAKRTTELAAQATQKTKQFGHAVQDKVRDSNLLDSLSKGVDSVTAKLQNVRLHGLRGFESYVTGTEQPAEPSLETTTLPESNYGSTNKSGPLVDGLSDMSDKSRDAGWLWSNGGQKLDGQTSAIDPPAIHPVSGDGWDCDDDDPDGWTWGSPAEEFKPDSDSTAAAAARRCNRSRKNS